LLHGMLNQRLCLRVLLLVGLVLVTAPAWGEEEDPQPGNARPAQIGVAPICPCTFGPLLVETAAPLEKGAFSIQPLFALSFTGGTFSPNWQPRSAGGDFLSLSIPVKFTYGLTSNLEVFVIVPYTHNWASHVDEPGPKGERNADFGGLGDIILSLKYRFVKETDTRPTVTAFCAVEFPSGHHSPLNPARLGTDEIGSGHYRFTGGSMCQSGCTPSSFTAICGIPWPLPASPACLTSSAVLPRRPSGLRIFLS